MEPSFSKAIKQNAGLASWLTWSEIAPAGIGVCAASVALAPTAVLKGCLAGLVLLAIGLWWIFSRPRRWVVCFLICAILLPPLPLSGLGNSGPHVALLFPLIGIFVGLVNAQRWRTLPKQPALALLLFTFVLFASVGSALFYSGPVVAAGTLARVGLFAIAVYVFAFTISGADRPEWIVKFVPWLFRAAVAAAIFACLDFYFQFPALGRFGEQFVWFDSGDVIRRAQGLFYESSTLGNFCVFFLVMIMAVFSSGKNRRILSGLELGLGALVFALTIVLSYSRGSLANLAVASAAMIWLRGVKMRSILLGLCALAVVSSLLYLLFPSFGESYWLRLETSFLYLNSSPEMVLSGRVSSWGAITQFLSDHTWQNVFGIGYKTLPYTTHLGEPVIADNTYLELLVEIGIVGLCVFLWMNFALLRAALGAARNAQPAARFFGNWFFCFWIGELVQMLSGDLITYWRVLPIYLWVLAAAMLHSRVGGRLETPR
jgi:O-Antigen ligase